MLRGTTVKFFFQGVIFFYTDYFIFLNNGSLWLCNLVFFYQDDTFHCLESSDT